MYTIDTSVWLDAFNPARSSHAASRELLDLISIQRIAVVVPDWLLVEAAAAVSRSRNDPMQGRIFALTLRELTNVRFVALDEALLNHTIEIAADYRLRAGDALYSAVAVQAETVLVSSDDEQRLRVAAILLTQTPAEALLALRGSRA